MGLTHSYVSTKIDPVDTTIIGSTKWNDNHIFVGGNLGAILYQGASGVITGLNSVAAGSVLMSNGVGAVPVWGSNLTIVNDSTTNTDMYPVWVTGTGVNPLKVSTSKFTFNPSTGDMRILGTLRLGVGAVGSFSRIIEVIAESTGQAFVDFYQNSTIKGRVGYFGTSMRLLNGSGIGIYIPDGGSAIGGNIGTFFVDGGLHVGGQSDPGDNNLLVDGDLTVVGSFTGGVIVATSNITNDVTTAATMYPVWVTANTGNLPLKVSSTKLGWIPNPGTFFISEGHFSMTASGGSSSLSFNNAQNAQSYMQSANTNNGTAASGGYRAVNSASGLVYLEVYAPAFTTSGYKVADGGAVYCTSGGGLSVAATAGVLRFYSGNGTTLRASFLTGGQFLIGTITAAVNSGLQTISYTGATLNALVLDETANTNTAGYIKFSQAGTIIGSVDRVGATAAVAYNTTSDARMKKSLGLATDLSGLRALRVHDFTWTDDPTGFIDRNVFAQEAYKIMSRGVTPGTNGEDFSKRWMIDKSAYIPDLIIGWQQHDIEIAKLRLEIDELKTRN